MKKSYLRPTSLVLNLDAEQMIAASGGNITGDGTDYPVIDGTSNHLNERDFEWESAAGSDQGGYRWE